MKQTKEGQASQSQPNKKAWLAPDAVTLDTVTPQHDRIVLELPPLSEPTVNESSSSSPTPTHNIPLKLRVMASFAAVLCMLTGIAGVYSLHHSILPVKVANLSATHEPSTPSFQAQLTNNVQAYRLRIALPDGSMHSYSLQEAGITPDIPATVHAAQTTHSLRFWKPLHVPLAVKVDSQKLHTFILVHATAPTKQPQNATIQINDGRPTIVAEQAGYGMRIPNATPTIMQHVGSLDNQPLVLTKGVINPAVTRASLGPLKTRIDAILAQHIKVSIHDTSAAPSPADIGKWLTIQPNTHGVMTATVNQQAVKAYLEQYASPYTAAAPDTVTATGTGSAVQIVQQQGSASIANEQSLIDTITNHLLEAKGQTVSVQIEGTPSKTITAQAQPKWLLVNLTTKRMYAYENTTLVRTFLVSAGAPATPTVVGTYRIYAKYAAQDMRGQNADGSNYFQPNVPYVNYFYKDYAVHGNYWRPAGYFGNINSSHGCVGVQSDDAKWVYNWAPIGTQVVTHV